MWMQSAPCCYSLLFPHFRCPGGAARDPGAAHPKQRHDKEKRRGKKLGKGTRASSYQLRRCPKCKIFFQRDVNGSINQQQVGRVGGRVAAALPCASRVLEA